MEKEQADSDEWHNPASSKGFTEKMTHLCTTCGEINPSQKHMSETCPMMDKRDRQQPIKRQYHLMPCPTCHKTNMKISRRYEMNDDGTVQGIEQLSCSHCGNMEEHLEKN